MAVNVATEPHLQERFREGEYLPHVTVDCVIFGSHEGELKVLLLKWKHLDAWSLPGGPVRLGQSVEDAAADVLEERTGLHDVYLRQFRTFGGIDRGESVLTDLFRALQIDPGPLAWLAERTVSVGFYALVDFSDAAPTPDVFSEACAWWDIDERPSLLFDHDRMIAEARRTMQRQLAHEPIGLNLLPDTFTMPELQQLYETILGRELDRRNFDRKIKNLGIVERLDERRTGVAHRAPYLYRFDETAYDRALSEGLAGDF